MRHLDEGTIHAWLDDALSSEEAARAEAHVASCTGCADAVAEARGLIAASSRILLALDNVPNVKRARGAKDAEGARWGRPSLATWLVRERIAAVVALVVAGGALALMLSRGMPRDAVIQVASEPVHTVDLTAADSPSPAAVEVPDARKDGQARPRVAGRGGTAAQPPARDLALARQADSAPLPAPQAVSPVTADVAAAPAVRTDDSLRSIVVAQAQREEAREASAEAKPSVGEKLAGAFPRRRAAADASARLAEPRAMEPSIRGLAGGVTGAGDPHLVQEERMTEGGREVRRRIYRVDGILVTLDERLPAAVDEVERVGAANAAPAAPPAHGAPTPRDSTAASTNTIRWTDARGVELTLTGPASEARLERIRKVLGY